jgi:DNA-binding winged helix-turn-helix (wHTH) protein/predicted ATPase
VHVAEDAAIRFGRYLLHPTQGLTRGRHEIHVTAKSLAVLRALVLRAGDIVTKRELFASAWPDTAVSNAALTSCIKELRRALHDDARRPRYIETVHRRGYRFIGSPSRPPAHIEECSTRVTASVPVVGRAHTLRDLHGLLADAMAGVRQFIFVTGEAGVGKTTLVERFVFEATSSGAIRVGWSQCAEHHGQGEPYQPLLEALTRLSRDPGVEDLAATLSRYAPTWLAQLPALQPHSTIGVPTMIATPERMVRELADALEALTSRVPLILWLEDLHWSDASTMEWIAAAARRRRSESTRLLVIATSRPAEGYAPAHPLGSLIDQLRVKGLCREIAVQGLDEAAVAEYIARRFPQAHGREHDFEHVARLVHRKTQGNPLFVGHVVTDLCSRGWFVETPDGWEVRAAMDAGELGVPEDLRRMIECDIEKLSPPERELLEVGSVAGATFSAAAVGAVLGSSVADVETTFGSLARRQQFVREAGAMEWPDGTVATQFEFVHAIHRDVLYQRLPAGRLAALHRAVGDAQERAYGGRAAEIAAELAMHFDRGFDHPRAVVHLHVAAEVARRRSAYREAQMHLERALTLLERQSPSPLRDEREIALRISLGSTLQVVRGWGAKEVEDSFARARKLSEGIDDVPSLFPAMWGLWLFYWGRGSLDTAGELAGELQALARKADDSVLQLQAHHAAWATSFSCGDFLEAHAHVQEGLSLYQAAVHAPTAATYGNHDAAVCGASFDARLLMLMGRAEEAVGMSEWAVEHARALAHPSSVCQSLTFAAWVQHLRRDPGATGDCAEAAADIARNQSLRLLLAQASISAGWVTVQQGQHEHGLRRIREAIADIKALGSVQFLPHLLGMLADACVAAGDCAGGLEAVESAFAGVESTGERFYEAELHRLKGELLLMRSPDRSVRREAEDAFDHALDIARRQGAALLALRAAMSLARLRLQAGPDDEACEMVSAACAQVAAGGAVPDVRDAFDLIGRAPI